jgi:hypothetical protein
MELVVLFRVEKIVPSFAALSWFAPVVPVVLNARVGVEKIHWTQSDLSLLVSSSDLRRPLHSWIEVVVFVRAEDPNLSQSAAEPFAVTLFTACSRLRLWRRSFCFTLEKELSPTGYWNPSGPFICGVESFDLKVIVQGSKITLSLRLSF